MRRPGLKVLVLLLLASTLVVALVVALGSRSTPPLGSKGEVPETEPVLPREGLEPEVSRASGAGGSEPRAITRPEGGTEQRRARVAGEELEDTELIERIRESLVDDPRQALQLLSEHERRAPDSPNAETRDELRVFALSNAKMVDQARSAAARYLKRYPEGRQRDLMHRRAHGRGEGEPPRQITVRDETSLSR